MQSRDDLCCPALIACHVHVAEEMPPHEGSQGAPRSITWRTLHTCRESNSQVFNSSLQKGNLAQATTKARSAGASGHIVGLLPPPCRCFTTAIYIPIARMQTR